jgi:hypothetical protein
LNGRRAQLVAILIFTIVVLGTSCTQDPSAKYFPNTAAHASPPASTGGQSAFDVSAGALAPRLLHGAVSRPDPKLTPGAVADSELTTVCRGPKRLRGLFTPGSPLVSPADQQAIFDEYHIPAANTKHYGLDFLVPLQLGGANARVNMWPASTSHGVGFHEKEVLNIRLHELVCRRDLQLDQAQKAVAADWVKLWLVYG